MNKTSMELVQGKSLDNWNYHIRISLKIFNSVPDRYFRIAIGARKIKANLVKPRKY